MSAAGLKWLSMISTLVLAGAFGWAVASMPKPDSAVLHPRLAGKAAPPAGVRPGDGSPALTQTYVS